MPKLKILHKLMLLIGGFALLFVVLTAVGLTALDKFAGDVDHIVSVARPMNHAAYEMEINVVEVGLRVVKYLQKTDVELRPLIEDEITDFYKFHALYKNLAFTDEQKTLAVKAEKEFSDYVSYGRQLLDGKDAFSQAAAGVADSFLEMEEITDLEIKKLGANPAANREVLGELSGLRIELTEAVSLINVATYADSESGIAGLTGEMRHIQGRIDNVLASYATSDDAAEINGIFKRAGAHLQQLLVSVGTINKSYAEFIDHRRILDNLLDDEIQVKTLQYLQGLNAEQQSMAAFTRRLVAGIVAVWVIMMAGAVILVSRGVVTPVNKLVEAAEALSSGVFSHRTGVRNRGDELGNLAQAFDIMAERLQMAYEKLSATNVELDQKVEARTQELSTANEKLQRELTFRQKTELQLLDAVEAANASSESKTLFLGNMSHELRTPLNAIIGFSDVIIHEMFGPVGNAKYADYAKDINQSGIHLLTLINELLDVARIESGKLTLTEEAFDLGSVLETCLHMHSEIASKRQIFLVRDIDDNLPFMFGDHTRVQQIFTNVIGNAIKFTPPEGSVKLCATHGSDGSLELSVTDTGIGIAPENISRVFETFGQVANVLTRAHEGAGLGLPLAKLLTERHDGVLEIASELGLGTTITVRFPASRVIFSKGELKQAAL